MSPRGFLYLRTSCIKMQKKKTCQTDGPFSMRYCILTKRSAAFVKLSIALSASPCSSPSRTQCLICHSKTTLPQPFRADRAALIKDSTSSQGTSSSTIRSIACTCPMIFLSLRCRLSAFMHCFMTASAILFGYLIV